MKDDNDQVMESGTAGAVITTQQTVKNKQRKNLTTTDENPSTSKKEMTPGQISGYTKTIQKAIARAESSDKGMLISSDEEEEEKIEEKK